MIVVFFLKYKIIKMFPMMRITLNMALRKNWQEGKDLVLYVIGKLKYDDIIYGFYERSI